MNRRDLIRLGVAGVSTLAINSLAPAKAIADVLAPVKALPVEDKYVPPAKEIFQEFVATTKHLLTPYRIDSRIDFNGSHDVTLYYEFHTFNCMPSKLDLKCSYKGIEQWSYYKHFEKNGDYEMCGNSGYFWRLPKIFRHVEKSFACYTCRTKIVCDISFLNCYTNDFTLFNLNVSCETVKPTELYMEWWEDA